MVMDSEPPSMLSLLLKKLADCIRIEKETKGSTQAAQNEVWRQIHQISGDPIKGKKITKSGPEN